MVCHSVQFYTMFCHSSQFCTMPCNSVPFCATLRKFVPCRTIVCHSMQFCTILCQGLPFWKILCHVCNLVTFCDHVSHSSHIVQNVQHCAALLFCSILLIIQPLPFLSLMFHYFSCLSSDYKKTMLTSFNRIYY